MARNLSINFHHFLKPFFASRGSVCINGAENGDVILDHSHMNQYRN